MEKWIKGEWISGLDLLAEWKIRDFELVEYIRDGLQPYDKRGVLLQIPPLNEVTEFLNISNSKTDNSIIKIFSLLPNKYDDFFSPSEEQQKTFARCELELRKEWVMQHIPDFLFKLKDVSDFEAAHGLRAQEQEPQRDTAPESSEAKGRGTILRQEQAMTVARIVRRDFPNLTIKEAAMEINARLAAMGAIDKDGHPLMQGYSIKHLMRLIKHLGFKPGKPGRISQK